MVAYGKKTQFVLVNESDKIIDKYIVDECLLRSKLDYEKCDYLFRINGDKVVYLIECKGSEILKAVSQLNSTLDILKNDLLGYVIKARVISTKVHSPDMRTERYKLLRARLNGNLETKNIKCVETI